MKNILITGGAGFIGSSLALKLIEQGHHVRILDNLSPQIHGTDPIHTSPTFRNILTRPEIDFHTGDIINRESWISALKDMDIVVHLAAETGTGQSMYEIERYTQVNIGGTALLLDILTNSKHSVRKILIASSRAIYGEGKYYSKELGIVYPKARKEKDLLRRDFEVKYEGAPTPLELLPTDETSQVHPTSLYGITKQVQEQMIMTMAPVIGIVAVGLRYQNVYGPGQSLNNPYTGILSIFSSLIKSGKGINIFEDGKESRDFVYIDDVISATIAGIEHTNADNEVFNVGSGYATDVLTVAQYLMQVYEIQVPLTISGNFRIGDIRHNFADLKKIERLLGFKAQWPLLDGLKKFSEWVNTTEIGANSYEKSLQEMKDKGLLKQ